MKTPAFRICVLALVTFLILLMVILLTLLYPNSNTENLRGKFCLDGEQRIVDTYDRLHTACEENFPLIEGCNSSRNATAWRIFKANSSDWKTAIQRVGITNENSFALFVSPVYVIDSSASCALQISFHYPTTSIKIILSSQSQNIIVNLTSGSCKSGVITDKYILEHFSPFRVFVLSMDPTSPTELHGSVTSQKCHNFKSIQTQPRRSPHPDFTKVKKGLRNRCSADVHQREIFCDWWFVSSLGNVEFTRADENDCVRSGVSQFRDDPLTAFLILRATQPDTRGHLISPIIERASSHLLLSFWYIAQCSGSTIKIYVVPSYNDICGVLGKVSSSVEFKSKDYSYEWIFKTVEIEIPPHYTTYQIVIEGQLSSDGNCSGHFCYTSNGIAQEEPPKIPLIALDDIILDAKYPPCVIKGVKTGSVVDCSFQSADNSSTYCSWISSAPPSSGLAPEIAEIFNHWKLENTSLAVQGHGATTDLLKGRGFVATQTGSNENYLRTPLLVANSNCSCRMTFFFLLRGYYAPRLQVNLVLGTNVEDIYRHKLPQWSVYGHQTNDWVSADIQLNLSDLEPFQVEIRVQDFVDQASVVNIDDIFFANCDFQLYSAKERTQ